jgi:hypothetical protein
VEFKIEKFNVNDDEAEKENIDRIIESFVRPFELDKAPLMRVGVIKRKPGKYILMVDIHHITADVISLDILVREFQALFNGEELPGLKIQYKDFVHWQKNLLQAGEIRKQENFWLNEFKGDLPLLNLPTDYARPEIKSFAGNSLNFEIPVEESRALKQLALRTNASIFMILLAVYVILLAKLSGQDDIVVGVSPGGRNHSDLEPIIGFFVTTLALRNYPRGHKTFSEFLLEVRKRTLQALDNQDYQFEDLCERVIKKRDPARNPLFDVMFTMQNKKISGMAIPGLKFTPYNRENLTAKFDLNLNGYEIGDQLGFLLEYCTKLFNQASIRVFINHFKKIISSVVENPDVNISDIVLTSIERRNEIISQGYDELENE